MLFRVRLSLHDAPNGEEELEVLMMRSPLEIDRVAQQERLAFPMTLWRVPQAATLTLEAVWRGV